MQAFYQGFFNFPNSDMRFYNVKFCLQRNISSDIFFRITSGQHRQILSPSDNTQTLFRSDQGSAQKGKMKLLQVEKARANTEWQAPDDILGRLRDLPGYYSALH